MAFWARKYFPVCQQEKVDEFEDMEKTSSDLKPLEHAPAYASKRTTYAIWIPWLFVLCLVISNLYTRAKLKALTIPNQIYCKCATIQSSNSFPKITSLLAPAASAIRYKNIRWTAGVADDRTPYQGWPNEENNRLWQDLYDRMKDERLSSLETTY